MPPAPTTFPFRWWMLAPIGVVAAAVGSAVVLIAHPSSKSTRRRDADRDERVSTREERRARRSSVEGDMPPLPRPAFTVAPLPTFSAVSPFPVPPPSSTTPKVSVAIGGASVTGGNVANAASVVAGMAAGFRRCYNRALLADPTVRGTIRVKATLGPSGEVLGASASSSTPLSAVLMGCVRACVASAQFAPPDGGAATIAFPITFTP